MTSFPKQPVFEIPPARSKRGVLTAFARTLGFPSYFGHNLDALRDSLEDFLTELPEPSTLIWNVDPEFKESKACRDVLSILAELESQKLRVVVHYRKRSF